MSTPFDIPITQPSSGGGSPFIGFRIYPTSSSAANRKLNFQGVDINSGIYSTATGEWTIAVAGKYFASVMFAFYLPNNLTGYCNSNMDRRRGTNTTTMLKVTESFTTTTNANVNPNFSGSALIDCEVGDVFYWYFSGSSLSDGSMTTSGGAYDTNINFFKVN